jgi:hypothetical protein
MTKPKEIKSPAKCEAPDDAEIDEALAETFARKTRSCDFITENTEKAPRI